MFSVGRRQDCLVVNTKLCVMHIRITRSLQKSLKNQTKQKQKVVDPNTIFFFLCVLALDEYKKILLELRMRLTKTFFSFGFSYSHSEIS